MLRDCPACEYHRATAADAWGQHRDRQRELCNAHRHIADLKTIAYLLAGLLALAILTHR